MDFTNAPEFGLRGSQSRRITDGNRDPVQFLALRRRGRGRTTSKERHVVVIHFSGSRANLKNPEPRHRPKQEASHEKRRKLETKMRTPRVRLRQLLEGVEDPHSDTRTLRLWGTESTAEV